MNRFPHALIGSATTKVRHRMIDVGVGWVWFLIKKINCRHDEPGLAISALWDLFIDPGLLDMMQRFGCAQAFDRGDTGALGKFHRKRARADDFAVNVDRTRSAQALAAAKFCAFQSQLVPQHP